MASITVIAYLDGNVYKTWGADTEGDCKAGRWEYGSCHGYTYGFEVWAEDGYEIEKVTGTAKDSSGSYYDFTEYYDDDTDSAWRGSSYGLGSTFRIYWKSGSPTTNHKLYVDIDSGEGSVWIENDEGENEGEDYEMYEGETAYIYASPTSGYTFTKWDDGNTTQNGRAITMGSSDITKKAIFSQQITYRLLTTADPSNGGSPYPSDATQYNNSEFSIRANPNTGNHYHFVKWVVLGSSPCKPDDVSSENTTVRFSSGGTGIIQAQYALDTKYYFKTNAGTGGSASPSSEQWDYTNAFVATATADSGYRFKNWTTDIGSVSYWSGYSDTSSTTKVSVNYNSTTKSYYASLYANFVRQYKITVTPDTRSYVSWNNSSWSSSSISQTVDTGTSVTMYCKPNTGYKFSYWENTTTGATDYVNSVKTITVTSAQSWKCHVVAINYTVSTSVSPSGAGSVSGGGTNKHYEDQISLKATSSDQYIYEFDHWEDGSGTNLGSSNPLQFNMPAQNVTRVAYFVTPYTLKLNSTTGGSVSPSEETTKTTNSFDIKATHNTGYHFVKWENDTGSVTYNSGSSTSESANISVRKDATLGYYYASLLGKFEENTYTIHFDTNGGYYDEDYKDKFEDRLLKYSQETILPGEYFRYEPPGPGPKVVITYVNDTEQKSQTWTEDGYRDLSRWSINGVLYGPNETVSKLTTTHLATVTATATWGTCSFTLPTPIQEGYEFKGWYNGSTYIGVGGTKYDISASTTLTAKWEEKQYTISYTNVDMNGVSWGTCPLPQYKKYWDDITVRPFITDLPLAYRQKYTISFDMNGAPSSVPSPADVYNLKYNKITQKSWYDETNRQYTTAGRTYTETYPDNQFSRNADTLLRIMIAGTDVDLYADGEEIGYYQSLSAGGSSGYFPAYVYPSPAVEWANHTFIGWSENSGENNIANHSYDAGNKVLTRSDKTLYAVWREDANYKLSAWTVNDGKTIVTVGDETGKKDVQGQSVTFPDDGTDYYSPTFLISTSSTNDDYYFGKWTQTSLGTGTSGVSFGDQYSKNLTTCRIIANNATYGSTYEAKIHANWNKWPEVWVGSINYSDASEAIKNAYGCGYVEMTGSKKSVSNKDIHDSDHKFMNFYGYQMKEIAEAPEETVKLYAHPAAGEKSLIASIGYVFDRWSDGVTINPRNFSVPSSEKMIFAIFSKNSKSMSVQTSPTGLTADGIHIAYGKYSEGEEYDINTNLSVETGQSFHIFAPKIAKDINTNLSVETGQSFHIFAPKIAKDANGNMYEFSKWARIVDGGDEWAVYPEGSTQLQYYNGVGGETPDSITNKFVAKYERRKRYLKIVNKEGYEGFGTIYSDPAVKTWTETAVSTIFNVGVQCYNSTEGTETDWMCEGIYADYYEDYTLETSKRSYSPKKLVDAPSELYQYTFNTVNDDIHIYAEYRIRRHVSLTVLTENTKYGTVTVNVKRRNEGGTTTYPDRSEVMLNIGEGDSVTFEANALEGHQFDHWEIKIDGETVSVQSKSNPFTFNPGYVDGKVRTYEYTAVFDDSISSIYFSVDDGDDESTARITYHDQILVPSNLKYEFQDGGIFAKYDSMYLYAYPSEEYNRFYWTIANEDGSARWIIASDSFSGDPLSMKIVKDDWEEHELGEHVLITCHYLASNTHRVQVAVTGGTMQGPGGGAYTGMEPEETSSVYYAREIYDSYGNDLMGQCTWYASGRTGEMRGSTSYSAPNNNNRSWGTAASWIGSHSSPWEVGSEPLVGSVGIMPASENNSYGHAVVVENVRDGGLIDISCFNQLWDCKGYYASRQPSSSYTFLQNTANPVLGTEDVTTSETNNVSSAGSCWVQDGDDEVVYKDFALNEVCTIEAFPNTDDGFNFYYWISPAGDNVEENPCTFNVTTKTEGIWQAVFANPTYNPSGGDNTGGGGDEDPDYNPNPPPEDPVDPEDPDPPDPPIDPWEPDDPDVPDPEPEPDPENNTLVWRSNCTWERYNQQQSYAYWNYKKNAWLIGSGSGLTNKYYLINGIESTAADQQWISTLWRASPTTYFEIVGNFTSLSDGFMQMMGTPFANIIVTGSVLTFEMETTSEPYTIDTNIHKFAVNCRSGVCTVSTQNESGGWVIDFETSCTPKKKVTGTINLFSTNGSYDEGSGAISFTTYPCNFKMYSCKIYDNGSGSDILVRDFVPVRRWHKEGVTDFDVGMWDMVFNRFYRSSARKYSIVDGTTTSNVVQFIPGDDILHEGKPCLLEKTYKKIYVEE